MTEELRSLADEMAASGLSTSSDTVERETMWEAVCWLRERANKLERGGGDSPSARRAFDSAGLPYVIRIEQISETGASYQAELARGEDPDVTPMFFGPFAGYSDVEAFMAQHPRKRGWVYEVAKVYPADDLELSVRVHGRHL